MPTFLFYIEPFSNPEIHRESKYTPIISTVDESSTYRIYKEL